MSAWLFSAASARVVGQKLLDPSALEEAGVRRVLLDVRRLALFIGVFGVVFLARCVARGFRFLGRAFVAPIGGRDGRHATGHVSVPL